MCFVGAFDGGKKMAPHEQIALEACSFGIRGELSTVEVDSDHASRVLKHYFQQKNELLAKEKLRQNRILEEMYGKHFPDFPLAVAPCRLPKEIPRKADPKRPSVDMVFPRAIEARNLEKDDTPRGCNFHSPDLMVWSELCYVPSAQPAARAWRNILF